VIWRLAEHHYDFPPPEEAEPSGLLAVGGDLHPTRVLEAYRTGVFPWFSEGQPILWWSPDPRAVLDISALRVRRSLRKKLRQQPYRITLDQAFDKVVHRCAQVPRPGQDGTWITSAMERTYADLHRAGHAHSAEAWVGERLVGGLYGVAVGPVFCGESMFADASDASKIAFVWLVRQLARWGFTTIDCQMRTEHLERFGARDVPRAEFLSTLRAGRCRSLREEPWLFDDDFHGEG
jgi:leucyl/phenylalanyl-tRNA--protein transferase